MSVKHFNTGNVWGRVADVKEEINANDKKFLSIHSNCSGTTGNVHAYGRLWGKERIEQFLTAHKKDPGAIYRFRGIYSQYLSASARLSNYSYFSWEVAPDQAPRAAFILKGEVISTDVRDGEGVLGLRLEREGLNGYKDSKEEFELWTFSEELVRSFNNGEVHEIKGFHQQGEGEDQFGSATGPVRPYILAAKKIEKK